MLMQAAGVNRVTMALLTAASFVLGAGCSSVAGYAGAAAGPSHRKLSACRMCGCACSTY